MGVPISTPHLIVCSYHVTYDFQSKSTLCIWVNVKELLASNRADTWSLTDCSRTRTLNHLVRERTLNHWYKLTKWLSWIVSTYLYGAFDCMFLSCRVRFSDWIYTLYFPDVQELLSRKRRDIWSLSDCNATGTHNHLVRKLTLNHLVKLAKSSSWIVTTYLQGAFDCMFLSCPLRVSEWIYTLYLPECHGTPWS